MISGNPILRVMTTCLNEVGSSFLSTSRLPWTMRSPTAMPANARMPVKLSYLPGTLCTTCISLYLDLQRTYTVQHLAEFHKLSIHVEQLCNNYVLKLWNDKPGCRAAEGRVNLVVVFLMMLSCSWANSLSFVTLTAQNSWTFICIYFLSSKCPHSRSNFTIFTLHKSFGFIRQIHEDNFQLHDERASNVSKN